MPSVCPRYDVSSFAVFFAAVSWVGDDSLPLLFDSRSMALSLSTASALIIVLVPISTPCFSDIVLRWESDSRDVY